YIWLVSSSQHNHAFFACESIHFSQDLVEGLLLLARASKSGLAPRTADGVEFIDKYNRGGSFPRLFEKITYSCRAHTDYHFSNRRCARRKEWDACFARYSSGQ